jgi:hypothetical protein
MTNSDSSPLHPGSFGVPGQGVRDWRQMGGGGGGGVRLGLHVVHIRPISTRELAAAYIRPLGCDLNSKFFFYNFL